MEYGKVIQLLHLSSGCFVSASKTVADEDNSCNKVELTSVPSSDIHWRAVGGFKYKQDGDKIHYNDQVIFYHITNKMYLHVTERFLKIDEG